MADPSNTNTLLLAQTVASFSRSELRWELAIIGAAVAILSIAVAAIALFCFRRGTRDLTLIYFGLLCILYAVRVLASFSSFRSIFNEPQMFWSYVNWVITCTIILPLGLFLYQLFDERLRNFFRWLLAAQTDRKSTRLNSSHDQISYAVFCLKKKKKTENHSINRKQHLPEDHQNRTQATKKGKQEIKQKNITRKNMNVSTSTRIDIR